MNILKKVQRDVPSRLGVCRRRGEAAFTMVEIALSIAIVAFAMVAIIGVLPTGFQVQRDNREETIINQDGTYLLEAIRSGGLGLDQLTNFVERITISNRLNRYIGARRPATGREIPLINGHFIVGMLSVPTYQVVGTDRRGRAQLVTNEVTAMMRSISGSASQRFQAEQFRDNSFTYLVTSTITPYVPFSTNIYARERNFAATNRFEMAHNVMSNLYDVRLHFRWPVNEFGGGDRVEYRVGRKEKVFRTLVSGRLIQTNGFPFFRATNTSLTNLYHFQSSTYSPPVIVR